MKQYMVIEHIAAGRVDEVYARYHARGRITVSSRFTG